MWLGIPNGKVCFLLCLVLSNTVLISAIVLNLNKLLVNHQLESNFDSLIIITIATCFAEIFNFFILLNAIIFAWWDSRPTQCYIAIRRGTLLAAYLLCYLILLLLCIGLSTPALITFDNTFLWFLLVASIFTALSAFIGFTTFRKMYNFLQIDRSQKYSSSKFCIKV